MNNRGQIFTTAFTIVVIITLAIIVVTTIVVIIYNNSRPVEPNIIYLDENQSYINGTIINITPESPPITNNTPVKKCCYPIECEGIYNNTDCDNSCIYPVYCYRENATIPYPNCTFNYWPYPDFNCTPGAIFPNATKEIICIPGYTATVRDVPESLKEKVYESYGVYNRTPYSYEIDHLISLELGGSNEQSNLWPEKYNDTMGARVKDGVENKLHRLVCNGSMNLTDAQYHIVYNWTAWI